SLSADPAQGWMFAGWTGDVQSMENPLSISMDSDKSITATFTEQQDPQGDELIVNGSFSDGDNNWHLGVYGGEASGAVVDGQYETVIDQAGSEHWHAQFTQGGIRLEQGKSYRLTFDARAVANRSIIVNVGQSGGAYTSYSEMEEILLTTSIQTYTVTFDMTQPTDENARVEFNSGLNDLDWYLDDVSLVEVGTSTPICTKAPVPAAWSVSVSENELILQSPVRDRAVVALYDIRGRIVDKLMSGPIEPGALNLSLSKIPAGNYILLVRTRSAGELYRKVISKVK
ncbi:MAG: carbohydrate binding domain-containing protein, partial [Chitinispirillaceae bacterium]